MMYLDQRDSLRRAEVLGLLERMFRSLEISPSQLELARQHYESVGRWLAESEDPLLAGMAIYLQGSTAIGTTIRPIGSDEHDVDLVGHTRLTRSTPPGLLKSAVGNRLKEHGRYEAILIEMPRCWRLNYAHEFHLDITPSIPNPGCTQGGELVPDRKVRAWKASNPKGYRDKFLKRAALEPRWRTTMKSFDREAAQARGTVETFPDQPRFKAILQRSVQISKRHRDVRFNMPGVDPALKPISVILTTLASQSYEYCVTNNFYDDALQLLRDVLRYMPEFIETRVVDGRQRWFIWNETTVGENFAEKWNDHPERADAFFDWHAAAVADLERLTDFQGLDGLSKRMTDAFGDTPTRRAIDEMTNEVSALRNNGRLAAAPAIGLVGGAVAGATPVAANTFFGR
jgi:hypothetical protein